MSEEVDRTEAVAQSDPVSLRRPWFHWIYLALPLPSGVVAVLLFMVLAPIIGLPVLLGWPGEPDDEVRSLVYPLMLVYSSWASFLVHERTARDHLAHLDEMTTRPDAYRVRLRQTTHFGPWALWIPLAGAFVPLLTGLVAGHTQKLLEEPRLALIWMALVRMLFWSMALGVLSVAAVAIARFRSLGWELVDVDLLDLDKLAPWPRGGLRAALAILGAAAIFFPAVFAYSSFLWIHLLVFSPFALLGVAAFLLPNAGLHSRIREAKLAELGRVRAAISGDPEALAGSGIAQREERPSLADLLAYRDHVAALREWPMNARALRRFGLYLLIPVGSWLCSALVERGLGLFLD